MAGSADHGTTEGRTAAVVRSRLSPPRTSPTLVPRDLLVRQVIQGLGRRAVLLLAGPGYGKTVLLTQVVARLGLPFAWLSCDERMRESPSLLAHLSAALGAADPDGARPDDTAVDPAALCNAIGARTSEVVMCSTTCTCSPGLRQPMSSGVF